MSAAKDPLDPISLAPQALGADSDELSRSPLLVLFGLVVVWGSLYLVAIAQNLSYAPNPVVVVATPAPLAGPPLPGESAPAGSMLAPVESLSLKEVPARQVVKDLLYKAHLHVSPAELDKISSEATDLHVEGRPLYECLYSASGQEDLGWTVLDNEVRLVDQVVTHQFPDSGPLEQFNWEVEVDVFPRPLSLFPSGRSALWLKLWLIPPDSPDAGAGRIAFEVYRGAVREASGEALLPPPSGAAIRFIPSNQLGLRIENRTPAPAEGAGAPPPVRVAARLQVQSQLAGPAAEGLAPPILNETAL